MTRKRQSPEFLALARRQLDLKLKRSKKLATLSIPTRGWIRAIRTALGMTAVQFGKRLGMSPQGALDLERRELNETITVSKLRQAADGLNCELHIAFVPRTSLDQLVQHQARLKARQERNRIVHTMRLEAQEGGVESALDMNKSVESWLTARLSRLWD